MDDSLVVILVVVVGLTWDQSLQSHQIAAH